MVMNGGPLYEFTEATSMYVECETQEEIDFYWEKLSKGGKKSRVGWLKDKFGLSWQIIPTRLEELLYDKDPERSIRVMKAMLKMNKIIIRELDDAYNGN
jgi:predicted 3-demethylubiquinone-9 3-methyltransferase (glyoxalase superfamily)